MNAGKTGITGSLPALATWLLAAFAFLMPPAARAEGAASAPQPTAQNVVDALEAAFGVTPGQRRNHIKGICAGGVFVGKPNPYSRSALFSGRRIPVIARFSLAGGKPNAPDAAKSPRGMALEFRISRDALQHMTLLNTPVFGAAVPQTFLDAIVAARPDPATGKPDPEKIKAFRASHPDSQAQAAWLASHNPPPSYANSAFYGIHTFKFVDRKGRVTLVRWRFVPRDGEKQLTDAQLKDAPHDFLDAALEKRVHRGPLRWDMVVTLGEPGDTETDPTVEWPAARKQVTLGTLSLTRVMPGPDAACTGINYDPLVMSDGIAPSADPILLFRSPAYGVSYSRRISGK